MKKGDKERCERGRDRERERDRERDGDGESDRLFRRVTCHVQVVEPDREPELEKRLSAVEEGVRILLADKAETDERLDAILSALDHFAEGSLGAQARENDNGEPLVHRSRSSSLPVKVRERIFFVLFLAVYTVHRRQKGRGSFCVDNFYN